MSLFLEKIKEAVLAVIPIGVIVVLLHLFVTPLEPGVITRFLIGVVFMMIGMPIFLSGVDLSIDPIGTILSRFLLNTGKMSIILGGSLFLGFVISVAEPDLHILANQVNDVTGGNITRSSMILVVSMGIGTLVALAIYRIIRRIKLKYFFTAIYLLIFALGLFSDSNFLAIAFDASGTTTGSLTVPFLLAMASGASAMTRSRRKSESDSFGLLGIASAGAIVAVLVMGLFSGSQTTGGILPVVEPAHPNAILNFLYAVPTTLGDILFALTPILVIFLIVNYFSLKLHREEMVRIALGVVYTVFGLVLFMAGVNTGFMEASRAIGAQLAVNGQYWVLFLVGLGFGLVTIPAEPSVHILTQQIESETAGSIKALRVMVTLAIGVALAVVLSLMRILIPNLELWHILLPAMIIAISLMYIIPDIFVGIAFDSGGVASGTMTAAFILPFAQGAAQDIATADVLTDGFGVIALVATTPLIALQLLGLIYKVQLKRLHPAQKESRS